MYTSPDRVCHFCGESAESMVSHHDAVLYLCFSCAGITVQALDEVLAMLQYGAVYMEFHGEPRKADS